MSDFNKVFHAVCIILIIIGLVKVWPTRGMLTTRSAKVGAFLATLGLVLEGMAWTGMIGSILAFIQGRA